MIEVFRGKDGRDYPVTAQHYYAGKLFYCPVCQQRPCHWDCSEQRVVDERRRPALWCYCGTPEGQAHQTEMCLIEGVVAKNNYREEGDRADYFHTPEGDFEDGPELVPGELVLGGMR